MKTIVLFAFAMLLVAASASADHPTGSLVVCESKNNVRHTCRADVRSGVVLSRQLSDNRCVLGRTWGTTRNGKAIWVDDGCRAEFLVGGITLSSDFPAARIVPCASKNNRQERCPADTTAGVQLARQISKNECALGRTWGFDHNGIWVTKGCRAEFAVGPRFTPPPMISSAPPAVVVCESTNNARNLCRVDTRFGVTLLRQLSDSACRAGETWGYTADGIWVTRGCRGEFVLTATP